MTQPAYREKERKKILSITLFVHEIYQTARGKLKLNTTIHSPQRQLFSFRKRWKIRFFLCFSLVFLWMTYTHITITILYILYSWKKVWLHSIHLKVARTTNMLAEFLFLFYTSFCDVCMWYWKRCITSK